MITTVPQSIVRNKRIGKNIWTVPGHFDIISLNPESLEDAICRIFQTQKEYLTDKIRSGDRIFAKHFYRYFFSSILKLVGRRVAERCHCDRCTIINSVKLVHNLFETDPIFRGRVFRILKRYRRGFIIIDKRPTLVDVICEKFSVPESDLIVRHINRFVPKTPRDSYRYILWMTGTSQYKMSLKFGTSGHAMKNSIDRTKQRLEENPDYRHIIESIIERVKNNEIIINYEKS